MGAPGGEDEDDEEEEEDDEEETEEDGDGDGKAEEEEEEAAFWKKSVLCFSSLPAPKARSREDEEITPDAASLDLT